LMSRVDVRELDQEKMLLFQLHFSLGLPLGEYASLQLQCKLSDCIVEPESS